VLLLGLLVPSLALAQGAAPAPAPAPTVQTQPQAAQPLGIPDLDTLIPAGQGSATGRMIQIILAVTVQAADFPSPTGTVWVTYGSRSTSVRLRASDAGSVTATLAKLPKGTYTVHVVYVSDDSRVGSGAAAPLRLTVR